MIEISLKLLAALAPAVIITMMIIRKDKCPEPTRWLLTAVGLGALVVGGVLLLATLILPDIQADSFGGAFLTSFLDAAIPEEVLKFAALYWLATHCKYFDEWFDGIVYAVCIGMGFAGVENILYLLGEDDWLVVSVSRALFAVPAHYFFAVIMGTFFALGFVNSKRRRYYYSLAILIPILVHGLYDTFCFSLDIEDELSGGILIVFLICFNHLRKYVKRLVESMLRLDEYVATGVLTEKNANTQS